MATDKGLEEIPEGKYSAHSCLLYSMICIDLLSPCHSRIVSLIFQFLSAQIESNYDEITDSFDSMNLKSELLRGKP